MHRLAPRLAAALAAGVLAAAASPARGQGPTAVIYPLEGVGVSRAELREVAALLQAALERTAPRGGFAPASPPFAQNACGPGMAAARECLARVAGAGFVLTAVVGRSDGRLAVQLRATDARGKTHGPVQAMVDPVVQNAEPLARALLGLQEMVDAAVAAEARRAEGPAVAREAIPRSSASRSPLRAPGAWRRSAGRWTTAVGLGLLAGGGVVAGLNRQLASELERKYETNQLTPEDAEDYRRVDTYNTLSTGLFVAGGTATAVGLLLWGTAPDVRPIRGGVTVGLAGRF
ncbi:MAG TPA: hypothetical protein VLS93_05910 [Anaeromyxobacteraceae bacterium]|nr:hypothetical protein [Anaeromyxobacteraceae bacterium]